jgi:hypothetical protein
MTVPVWVEQQNGTFIATVLGVPDLRADGPTANSAVAALRTLLRESRARGELVFVDIPEPPRRPYTEDELEVTREMVAEIYRERDEEKRREFPE